MRSFTSACLIFVYTSLHAQPGFIWQRTTGGSDLDILNGTLVDANNDIWVGGISASNISFEKLENSRGGYDYWILRFDNYGNLVWQKTIGGSMTDSLICMTEIGGGNVVLGGASSSNISGEKTEDSRGNLDYWVVKLNTEGSIIWQKTIGGNGADILRTLFATNDGGMILGGYSESGISGEKTEPRRGNGIYDYWIVKLDVSGNIQWQRTLGGDGEEDLQSVIQTSDGGYLIAGMSASNASYDKTENSRGEFDFWVLKLTASGAVVWQRTIGGAGGDLLTKAIETQNGKIVLAGYSNSDISGEKTENSRGSSDYWIVQLDSTGAIEWQRTIGGADFDAAYTLIETQSHHLLVGGTSSSNSSGEKTENSRGLADCWIVELDEAGNLLGQKTFGGDMADSVYSIKENAAGEIIVGGNSRSGISGEKFDFNRGETDFWVVKLTPESLNVIDQTISNLSLYPNPASGLVHISGTQENIEQLNVYDLLGKKILISANINSTNVDFDVSSLSQGIYLIEIETQNHQKTTKKLIVQ